MAMHADAVVSHQWTNDHNHLYLDVLYIYRNYPLIYSSPCLRDAGYYYLDFDAQEGGRQPLRAILSTRPVWRITARAACDRIGRSVR